jgi:hypothetical protein
MRIRDPGWKNSDARSAMEKVGSGIRDKHTGSATLDSLLGSFILSYGGSLRFSSSLLLSKRGGGQELTEIRTPSRRFILWQEGTLKKYHAIMTHADNDLRYLPTVVHNKPRRNY